MLRQLVIKFGRLAAALALVAGGLWPTGAQTPPSFPPSVAGQRQITWNYSGLRSISPVPPIGVQPTDVGQKFSQTACGAAPPSFMTCLHK